MTIQSQSGGTFGVLLRQHRVAAGFTQEQLAERSGLGVRTIRDLELGRVGRPHRESILLLSAALGLSVAARDGLSRAGGQPPLSTTPGTGPSDWLVPRQLPPAARHFTGRSGALKILVDLIDAPMPAGTVVLSAIDGTAGIGKTALALHFAHQVAERFPDGQLFVNLRGFDPIGPPAPPTEVLRGFLDALGVPAAQIPAGMEAQAARYRSELAGRRMLVLLDNAHDAAQVRPLLPGSPGCLVIVTSRIQLLSLVAADGAHPLTLDLLTAEEARELLIRRLGMRRAHGEREAVDELTTLCARLPLALNIMIARAASEPDRPLAQLAADLRDVRRRLDRLHAGDAATDLRAVFSWSYQNLGSPAARMFRLLGSAHPGPDISLSAAACLAGLPLGQARVTLDELTTARLLTEQPAGRFSFHDLLRAYAAEQAPGLHAGTEGQLAAHRVLDYYAHTVHRAARLIRPSRQPVKLPEPVPGAMPEDLADDSEAMSWLSSEYPVLLAAITFAAESGLDGHVWQIAWGLSDFLDRCADWQACLSTQHAALAAGQRLDDLEVQAYARGEIGYALYMLAEYADAHAHLQHSLELHRRLGNTGDEVIISLRIAHLLGLQHRNTEVLVYAREALKLARAIGKKSVCANALNTIGWYSAVLGDYQEALACCQEAYAYSCELDDALGQGATLDSLGLIHSRLGDHASALDCYQKALDIFVRIGDLRQEALTLSSMAHVHHAGGNTGAALTGWRQALVILLDLGDSDAAGVRRKLSQLRTRPGIAEG